MTVTSTGPPTPAGAVAVIEWRCDRELVAAVAPNLTAVAPVKLVPVIVTLVPPAAGPEDGLTAVTVGRGDVRVPVDGARGAGAAGGGDRDVDGARGVRRGAVAVIWVALLTVNDGGRCRAEA